jgi:hypothetical protein
MVVYIQEDLLAGLDVVITKVLKDGRPSISRKTRTVSLTQKAFSKIENAF